MIRAALLAMSIAGGALTLKGGSSRILLDQRTNGMWHRFIHLDSDSPSSVLIERLRAPFVRQTTLKVRRLVVGSKIESLWDASHKHMMFDAGPEAIMRRRREEPRTGQFLLEVLCIGRDCVQRSRDWSGAVQVTILSGSNPLIVEAGGKLARLAYLEMNPNEGRVRAVGMVDTGTLDDARLLFEAFCARLPGIKIGLTLREDWWFYESEEIPSSFLFWREEYPRDIGEFLARPFVICGTSGTRKNSECRRWYLDDRRAK